MESIEQLREALFDLNQQRNRDLAQLAQSQAVLGGLERIAAADGPASALGALLNSVRESTDCTAALLLDCTSGTCQAVASTDPTIGDMETLEAAFFTDRPRRIVDLAAIAEQIGALAGGGRYVSMISTPFTTSQGAALTLVCLSQERDKFTPQDHAVAERLLSLAAQTLETKRLADENALLAEVINRSSASFSIADASNGDCPLVYVNDAFEDLTGYSRSEAIGQNCRFLSAEPPDSPIRQRVRDTISQRTVGTFELRNRRKSGEIFWNSLSIFPVTAGDKPFVVATQWDLTTRIEAENARDQARQQLFAAMASAKEGLMLLDATDRIIFANQQYVAFHRLKTGALKAGAAFEAAWSDALCAIGHSAQQARRQAAEMLAKLKTPCVQREQVLPSGLHVLETNSSSPEGGVLCVLSDVTALKVAQQQLAERVAAIESMQDGIAITDMSGRIIYLNPSHVAMFGYQKPSQLLGRKWTRLYHSDHLALVEETAMPEAIATGTWRGEVIGLRGDGTPVAQEVTLTRLRDAGLICVTRDITERIQGEKERVDLRDQLHAAQRQEALGQMAAGLAHDFNNCLSVVAGSAELAKEASTARERAQHIGRITQASAKASELTSRLLRLGSRSSQRELLDLREPITSALDMVRSSLPGHVELTTDLPDLPIQCEADPTEVFQVIINLVINARDAIGAEVGRISVALEQCGGDDLPRPPTMGVVDAARSYAVIDVSDSGSGIAAADLAALFEAYVTTKSAQGGTGLGLSVVRSLVQANDGAVAVTSRPGEGSRFSILWPLRARQPSQTPQPQAQGQVSLSDVRAMVVDDEQQVAETIAVFLEKAGCEVVVCDASNEALLALEAEPEYWDIVITDYDMPGMNGAELAQQIRRVATNLPIILCTAVPQVMGAERAGARLFDARVPKPVDPKRLVQEIAQVLGK